MEDFLVSDYLPADIELSAHAISDPSKILESEEVTDAFVNNWSKNPFLLGGFISQFMRSNRVRGGLRLFLLSKQMKRL